MAATVPHTLETTTIKGNRIFFLDNNGRFTVLVVTLPAACIRQH